VNDRIDRLRQELEQPLLVTNAKNVLYLVGFDSSNAALLVDETHVRLYTDFRYIEAARAVDGVEAVQTRRHVLGEIAPTLSGRIGFEAGVLPYALYETLRGADVDPVPTYGLVERLRAVKDEHELGILRRACAITDRVFERLITLPFESIVGAGPTGSRPHARAGDRVIAAGELVVVDTGCTVDGYSSDYTRTFATGPLNGQANEAYEVVLAAQRAALAGIRAGVPAVEADRLARRVVDDTSFAGMFGHALGHGLGLDVHEQPRLSTETTDVLAPGNVVTVEPGIYVEGTFGVRIEDDVVVTDDGIENLTGFRKDLIEVG
jgi:Xaa-Pro aminopeptidase